MDHLIAELVDKKMAELVMQIAQLRQALGYFLDDERFQVQVGGNPNMVEWMLRRATTIYNSTAAPKK